MTRRRKRPAKQQVFKAQCDITMTKILVYNRNRSIRFEGELTPEMKITFALAGAPRLYFKGHLEGGKISLDELLPKGQEEDW